jgi:leader peptidase (prepilin peptidase) / N-methyltransferase
VQALLYVFAVLFGLVVGSFLNVVVCRVPRGESVVRPGSHCPQCQTPIRWYDNIPLVSYLVLRRRCRSCKGVISSRYAMVEAFTGLSFALCLYRFGLDWYLLVAWFFVSVLLCLALIDLDNMIIPGVIALPAAAIGTAAVIALDPGHWWVYLASAAGAALFCFLLAVLWPGGGMGGGDVSMALLVGGVLGFPSVLLGFFIAFLAGSVVGLYIILVLKRSRKTRVPFGPFLALGAYVALFAGEPIVNAYLNLFE